LRSSSEVNHLFAALSKAQAEMENAQQNKTNPHFRSKYADLASIRDATVPSLTKHGLTIIQFPLPSEDGLYLHTVLGHSSGQWIEGMFPLVVALDKPQVMGSFLTYARRYSHAGFCCIAAEEDDDANAASTQTAPKAKAKSESIKFPDELSAQHTATLLSQLDELKTATAVDDFAKENAGTYGRLIPDHQQTVREACNDRRAALSDK